MEEKELDQLKNIISDKHSFGAFSGMIFNKYVETLQAQQPRSIDIENLVKIAVKIRVQLLEMGSTFEQTKLPVREEEVKDNGHYEEYKVTCSKCKKETTVPFKPKYKRPVFCIDCYKEWQERQKK